MFLWWVRSGVWLRGIEKKKQQNSGGTKTETKLKDKNSSGSDLSWGHGERVFTCVKNLCISQAQTSAEGFVTNISGLFKRPWSAGTGSEARFSLECELEKSRSAWAGLAIGINFVWC